MWKKKSAKSTFPSKSTNPSKTCLQKFFTTAKSIKATSTRTKKRKKLTWLSTKRVCKMLSYTVFRLWNRT